MRVSFSAIVATIVGTLVTLVFYGLQWLVGTALVTKRVASLCQVLIIVVIMAVFDLTYLILNANGLGEDDEDGYLKPEVVADFRNYFTAKLVIDGVIAMLLWLKYYSSRIRLQRVIADSFEFKNRVQH